MGERGLILDQRARCLICWTCVRSRLSADIISQLEASQCIFICSHRIWSINKFVLAISATSTLSSSNHKDLHTFWFLADPGNGYVMPSDDVVAKNLRSQFRKYRWCCKNRGQEAQLNWDPKIDALQKLGIRFRMSDNATAQNRQVIL